MTAPPGRRGGAADGSGAEGWESLAEEAAAGALNPSPELEDSMREAAAAGDAAANAESAASNASDDGAASDAESAAKGGDGAARLAALEEAHAQLLDRHLRLQADFDNHRKRTSRERSEAQAASLEKLARDLLGGLDDLERAQQFADQPDGKLEDLRNGVELVRRELLGALGRHGLCEIEALGAAFDPKVHEAMAQAVHPDAAPGHVLEVLQRGYLLGGRLLRPARVVVAKAPEAPAAAQSGGAPANGGGTSGNGGTAAQGSGESAVDR